MKQTHRQKMYLIFSQEVLLNQWTSLQLIEYFTGYLETISSILMVKGGNLADSRQTNHFKKLCNSEGIHNGA